ncbi:hypothetical protein [Lacticaseibacillus camelliae]|nr:hypothetical protein [Lacticaseibacillus camelliae]
MTRRNNRAWGLRLIEPLIGLVLLGYLLAETDWVPEAFLPLIGFAYVAGFASYYGMGIGMYTWAATFFGSLYLTGVVRQQDVLLELWHFNTLLYWSGLLLVVAVIGGISSARSERYDDQVFQNETLEQNNEELNETLTAVNTSKEALKAKLLATDNQTTELFELFKVLDQAPPQLVPGAMVKLLQQFLAAENVAVYEPQNGALTRIAGSGDAGQSLTLAEPIVQRATLSKAPTIRTEADGPTAPIVVGAVHVDQQLAYIIGLDVALGDLTAQQMTLFSWFLKILGERMEAEMIRQAGYPRPGAQIVSQSANTGK